MEEWLSLLVAQPRAYDAFVQWVKSQEALCTQVALDVALDQIPVLKGKREAYREILAFALNNKRAHERSQPGGRA